MRQRCLVVLRERGGERLEHGREVLDMRGERVVAQRHVDERMKAASPVALTGAKSIIRSSDINRRSRSEARS